MLFDGGVTHQLAAGEDRRDGQYVQRVGRRPVGIAGQEQVAGLHGVGADEFNGLLQAVIIAAGEDGQAGRFGQHAAVFVVYAEAEVPHFVDDRAVGGAHEVAFHLARGGEQKIVDDLGGDGVQSAHGNSGGRCSD